MPILTRKKSINNEEKKPPKTKNTRSMLFSENCYTNEAIGSVDNV